MARLLLGNRGLRARLPAAADEWGAPAPWQGPTRVHSECRRVLLHEPRIVERLVWPRAPGVLRAIRAQAAREHPAG